MNRLGAGLVSGFAATAPMTAVMAALRRRLPLVQRYPLPPRQITMKLAGRAGLRRGMGEAGRTGLTLASHFAYGAAAGVLYTLLRPGRSAPMSAAKGAAVGAAVWTASYLGWLPAFKVLPPATRQPKERNALMIAAHLVWGAATGLLADRLGPRV